MQQFHWLVLQVCAADKPQVRKVMLLLQERLLLYRKHPDVLEFFSRNSARMDEEDIEFLNALIGRLVSSRQALDMKAYKYTSGLMKAIHVLTKRLDDIALRGRSRGTERKVDDTEHHKLRGIYATNTWAETNDKISSWILGAFKKAIDADERDLSQLDGSFPRHDRLKEAAEKMDQYIAELEAWLESCRRVVYTDETDGASST